MEVVVSWLQKTDKPSQLAKGEPVVKEVLKAEVGEYGSILQIRVDKITLNPYQPRKIFEMEQLEELAQSIKEYGVIQPITVRKNFIGGYELISGERRLRASKLAGLSTVPCIVIDADENDSAIIALLENLQRADLTFLEEAEAISHLVEEHKYTQEQLAKKLGKSQSAIANKLRLLRLPPIIKRIIADNALTERHARALLRIPDEQLQLKVVKAICENHLNVAQTDTLIDKTIKRATNPHAVHDGKIRGVVELRMFLNTVNKAVDVVKKAGVQIETYKREKDDLIEYIIKIPKNSEKIIL